MPPKKKAAAKSSAKLDEDDETTAKFQELYKKKCVFNECHKSPDLLALFEQINEENMPLTEIHLREKLKWNGLKAIVEALMGVNLPQGYGYLTSIKLWKCEIEDEGVRILCKYLIVNKNMKSVELMNNMLSPLSCEFLSRVLDPRIESQITTLSLDHNPIGSEGIIQLSKGLSMNCILEVLSLKYCDIDKDAADALNTIIIYSKSALKELHLQGNHMGNIGMAGIIPGLRVAPTLKKLNMADNRITEEVRGEEEPDAIAPFEEVFKFNKELRELDLCYNPIYDKGAKKFIELLEGSAIIDLKLHNSINPELVEEIDNILKKNKGGKKKGKGGGKGKKKKKKK